VSEHIYTSKWAMIQHVSLTLCDVCYDKIEVGNERIFLDSFPNVPMDHI